MSKFSYIRKKIGIVPTARVNKGDCYFCKLPVFVAEGQAYKEAIVKGQRFMSHKSCRKFAFKV